MSQSLAMAVNELENPIRNVLNTLGHEQAKSCATEAEKLEERIKMVIALNALAESDRTGGCSG